LYVEGAPVIVALTQEASADDLQAVIRKVEELGLHPEILPGVERTVIGVIGVIGVNAYSYHEHFAHMTGVDYVVQISKPYKLAGRDFHPANTLIDLGEGDPLPAA
jgi:3-deoxy-7-phosphoheptulonate synthase